MEPREKELLRTAILCINDPRGNWDYGWRLICELAEMNPANFPAPFRHRTAVDMMGLRASEQTVNSARSEPEPESPTRTPDTRIPTAAQSAQ